MSFLNLGLMVSVKHLYNGLKVGKDEVESVATWENGDGSWDQALSKAEADAWLVY